MTKIIIIAAGDGVRWNNYLGTQKGMCNIYGLPLLQDIVNKANLITEDVNVIYRDTPYPLNTCKQHKAKLNTTNHDADKFLSSQHLWNKNGRTVIMYGDCHFSRYLISVMQLDVKDWCFYGRLHGSELLNKKHGELFALSFYPEHQVC